jgi:hypothetical protein
MLPLLFFFGALFLSQPSKAQVGNEVFARPLGGAQSVQWGDYELLQRDAIACVGTRKETSACEALTERYAQAAWAALLQAATVNAGARGKKFCDKETQRFIAEKKPYEGAAYAILIIDDYMKQASSLYGRDPRSVYVGKIVYDALLLQSPCS